MKNLFRQTNNPQVEAGLQETKPFFWFMILVLVGLYSVTLYFTPELRQPVRLIPFTLLMATHLILHWYVPYFVLNSRRLAVYLLVQISLALALTVISQQQGIAIGLFLALAGETVGILEDWRRSLTAVLGYIALLAITFTMLWGWQSIGRWLGGVLLSALFVFMYVMMFLRQLNARAEAQELLGELQIAHRQLSEYAQQVETLTLEGERQRMARELHDTLAQGLAGLVLQLEALEANLERGNTDKAAQIVGQAKERARTTLADARRAIDDLRATAVTTGEAITREVDRFTAATGITCALTMPPEFILPPDLDEHVVRCVAEGLANVARHAQATKVGVVVEMANGRIRSEIRDNGRGFDAANGAIPTGHYGLLGLRERARLAGGALAVQSQPGSGTTLQMVLPITHAPQAAGSGLPAAPIGGTV